jgi:hypothetical protein
MRGPYKSYILAVPTKIGKEEEGAGCYSGGSVTHIEYLLTKVSYNCPFLSAYSNNTPISSVVECLVE